MLPRFGLALLLWFMLLICPFYAFVEPAEAEEVLASWYGPGFHGLPTASGEPYDAYGYTAAHKTLPLGTRLVVSYGERSVWVTVNDRGPYVGDRELDLSQGAAQELGLTQAGVDYVEYSFVDGGTYGIDYPDYSKSYTTAQVATNDDAYIVQPGETLSQIATRLGTSTNYLAEHNGIADPDLLYSGQILYFDVLEEDDNPLETGNDVTVGEEAVGFGAAVEDNDQLEPQIPDGTVTSDEPVVLEDDMMGNNVSTGEDAFVGNSASENGEPGPQMPDEIVVPDGVVMGDEVQTGEEAMVVELAGLQPQIPDETSIPGGDV